MIKVFHTPRELFREVSCLFTEEKQKKFAEENFRFYKEVAHVDTEDLGVAWEKTNTIDDGWWNNPEIKFGVQTRSTSVGDVMQVGEDYYVAAGFGFVQLDQAAIEMQKLKNPLLTSAQ